MDLNSLPINYCQIVGYDMGMFKKKVVILVDYGQKVTLGEASTIEDLATNKPVIFNSMVDALNFMDKNGWEYIDSYAVSMANSGSVYHYLLKRKNK